MIDTSLLFSGSQALHLRKRIMEISNCGSEDAAIAGLATVVDLMGFDRYHYVGNFPTRSDDNTKRIFSTLPAREQQVCTAIDRCPPMQAARLSIIPIICKKTHQIPLTGDIDFDQITENMIGDGVIFPIHTQCGHFSMLGCFVQAERSDGLQIIASSLGDGSLAAMYFHDTMTRIIGKSEISLEVQLTYREKECLRWIARHKSNWDISRILGVSEHTIVYYVRRLMQKLDARNRHDAVARARAYALI